MYLSMYVYICMCKQFQYSSCILSFFYCFMNMKSLTLCVNISDWNTGFIKKIIKLHKDI